MSDVYQPRPIRRPDPVRQPSPVVRPGDDLGRKRRRRGKGKRSRTRRNKQGTPPVESTQPADDNWWKSAPIAPPAEIQQAPVQHGQPSPSKSVSEGEQWWTQAPLAPEQEAPQEPPAPDTSIYDSYVKPAANWISETIHGKQDERFKDLPNIRDGSGIIMDGVADSSAVTDKAYRDIYIEALKEDGRFLGVTKDKHGADIIKFKGPDGSEKQAYVNKPGLDWHDFERTVSSALPYMFAGGVAGRLGIAGGALTNIGLQGGAAAVTSGLQDVAARQVGSKQDIDLGRMGMAAAFGAGGELVGQVAGPFIQKWIANRAYVNEAGELTKRGIRMAKKEGLDPSIVNKELADAIKQKMRVAEDPTEAFRQAQTDRFGIPTTKGQRTDDPKRLLLEKDARYGTLGDDAQQSIRNLDEHQKGAIETAARGAGDSNLPPRNAIAPRLAPGRSMSDQNVETLGMSAKRGFDDAMANMKRMERAAWAPTKDMAPRAGAFDSMQAIMAKNIGARRIDDQLTPAASSMINELNAFKKGLPSNTTDAVSEVVGVQTVRKIDQMRQRLMHMKDGAASNADRAAAKSVYKAYDEWTVDAAGKQLLTGEPGMAAKFLAARRTTAELRGMIKPMKNGKKTPAARALDKLGDAQTGDEVLNILLGRGSTKSAVPHGSVDTIKRFKAATTQLGDAAGKAAWNDVRLAYWLKTVMGTDGKMLGNQTLITSINNNFSRRKAFADVLFTKSEQKLMKQYAQAVKSATPKDPNPPGSGTAVRGIFPDLVKGQLQVAGSRAQLRSAGSGSVRDRLMGTIYKSLARVLPKILDGQNMAGRAAARRVTTQALTRKETRGAGGYGAALTPTTQSESRLSSFSPNQPLTSSNHENSVPLFTTTPDWPGKPGFFDYLPNLTNHSARLPRQTMKRQRRK